MKHKHHIIPKHMGGNDDHENIIELTIEEHAEAHKKLWEENGLIEDYLAWQGLSGLMKKEDIVKTLLIEAGKRGGKSRSKETNTAIARKRAAICWEKNKEKQTEVLRSNAMKNKMRKQETGVGLGGHAKGKYAWITNGIENKKIMIGEELPSGWKRGRTKEWNTGSSNKKKEVVECPNCGVKGGKPVMKRYHFENCKEIK